MPWTAADAHDKTHKAKSATAKRQWAHVANDAKARGASDASAIKQANAVVARRKHPGRAKTRLRNM